MAMSQLTTALASAPAASQRLQVAASASLAGVLASSMQAASQSIDFGCGLGPTASLSSPPRPATLAGYHRGTMAPSVCLAGGKTRRRKRRRPDGDAGGGGGDDGIGGGGWYGPWDDEPEEEPDGSGGAVADSDWVWRFCCMLTVLQTLHFLLVSGQSRQPVPPARASGLATLSQAFFTPRLASGPGARLPAVAGAQV